MDWFRKTRYARSVDPNIFGRVIKAQSALSRAIQRAIATSTGHTCVEG